MGIRVTELHCKEVICIADGRRLGFVSDVELELPEGRVLAILVCQTRFRLVWTLLTMARMCTRKRRKASVSRR